MTAIQKEDPADLPMAERKIPPALSRIVDRCLEKNPGARFASASDLAFALDALSAHSGSAPALADAVVRRRRPMPWVWAVAICLVALAAVLPAAIAHFREAPPAMTRFSVDVRQAGVVINSPPSISPDGRHVAFGATAEGANAIWIRSLEAIEPRRLAGIPGAQGLFWSPDSRSIAFFSEGKLKRTSATGGPVQILCDAAGIGGSGSWNRDGTIVFGRTGGGGVFRVSASGGAPVKLTTPDAARSETGHTHPFFLPGGDRFVYYAQPAGRLYVRSLDAQDDKELTASNSKAVYSPSGHLLFVRQGTLMAQAFDAARATLSGEAVPVAEGMGVGPAAHSFGVSDTGVLAYRPGVGSTRIQVTAFDRSGTVLKTIGEEGDYRDITLSPDGTRVIVHRHEDPGGGGLWLLDTVRGTTSRFTFAQSHDVQAQWSPDGTRVVFGSNRDGGVINLYQKLSNGAGPDEVLFTSAENKGASDWSSDGRFIVLELNHSKTRSDVWVLPLAGDRKPSPFLQSEFAEGHGRLSPDSRWMAYVSDETARNEVYIQPFPRSGGKWLVSTGGGIQPRWRRDGKELYYLAPAENGLLAVSAVDVLATGATVEVGKPRVVFTTRFAENVTPSLPVSSNAISQSYAPSADGQQFFVLSPATDTVPSPITVVMNWTTGLQKTD
jgi:Tol biopolymer transport system component